MATETITHDSVAQLAEAGAIRATHVVGQKGGWGLSFQYGEAERSLAAQRGNVRIFRKFEAVVTYLREIGIVQFDVDAAHYDPSVPLTEKAQSKAERARAQMQAAHAAAAYEKWFLAEVDQAMAEADGPSTQWVSHEDAMARLDSVLAKHIPARKGRA
jgi:hypothetical protein